MKIRTWLMLLALVATDALQVLADAKPGLAATDLRVESVSNPLGVDIAAPRLFWKLMGSTRGQQQTAYKILVASSQTGLAQDRGDLWDSGKVASDATIHIRYGGRPLQSSQRVFWKVRVWDVSGKESAWSEPGSWTMGVLSEADWQARWIGSQTGSETLMLRREFKVKPGLTRALMHVSGLGYYELTVNGRKASEDLLAPGWTKYDRTCLYDTHDLTPLLREGINAVGLLLGNGMYNVKGGRYTKFKGSFGPLKAIAHLRLEYADGTTESVRTDEQWRTQSGPITFSCVFGGEDYDARLERRGWDRAGFDDSGWQPAKIVTGLGTLKGLSAAAPPIRAFDVLRPVSVKSLNKGVAVYDLGQNASVMPRLTLRGTRGAVIKVVPAELLKEDGSVNRQSSAHGAGPAYWQYTLAGEGRESWFPKFFYHGSRYLQVELLPATDGGELPEVETLEGVVVHSASEAVGEFESSSELFNRIHRLVRWAQRSNMMSLLTDCPHRERLGWLEQYHLNGPSLRYEFDLARLFRKGMSDMADSQLDNGLVPDIAPEYTVFEGGFRDSPEWGSACVLVPWQQYEWTGDVELLRQYYNMMKRYVAYLGTRATGNIVSHGLGDWYDIGPKRPGVAQLTPLALTATAFYYQDARTLAQAARLLGKSDDAGQYDKLAAQIRSAFNQKFFDPANRQYATGSQCANSIPLVMDLVEPTDRTAVLDAVVQDVRHRGNAFSAGDVGYRYLLRALADGGRSDVIFDMNNQSDKPGYGYQLRVGATSLTEAWNADPQSSQNHFMLGQIMEWFYHDLAGIGSDPTGAGFKKILIRPQPVGDLTHVKASLDSVRGKIISEWSKAGGVFTLSIMIPPNTTATVSIPARSAEQVTESGRDASRSQGVKFLRQEKDQAIFEISSGSWLFQAPL